MILVACEVERSDDADGLAVVSRQALALARSLAADGAGGGLAGGTGADGEVAGVGGVSGNGASGEVAALVVDDGEVDLDEVAEDASKHGAELLHVACHDWLDTYGPEAWGQAVAAVVEVLAPEVVLAAGTDRGGEVMAHVAARLDLPLVANVTQVRRAADGWHLVRVRWGGSLLEHAHLDADTALLTMSPHAVDAMAVDDAEAEVVEHDVELDDVVTRTRVVEEVVTSTGISLATAPVVVGGGRGVGSAEGFEALERLADLLGGAVGCSRVATNSGWRPHSDQVGQTGTAIAPTIYIACGISGAIQHWAGAKSAKHVLAINTDAEANMVAKADWAVVGDLHQVVPALIAAIEAR